MQLDESIEEASPVEIDVDTSDREKYLIRLGSGLSVTISKETWDSMVAPHLDELVLDVNFGKGIGLIIGSFTDLGDYGYTYAIDGNANVDAVKNILESNALPPEPEISEAPRDIASLVREDLIDTTKTVEKGSETVRLTVEHFGTFFNVVIEFAGQDIRTVSNIPEELLEPLNACIEGAGVTDENKDYPSVTLKNVGYTADHRKLLPKFLQDFEKTT